MKYHNRAYVFFINIRFCLGSGVQTLRVCDVVFKAVWVFFNEIWQKQGRISHWAIMLKHRAPWIVRGPQTLKGPRIENIVKCFLVHKINIKRNKIRWRLSPTWKVGKKLLGKTSFYINFIPPLENGSWKIWLEKNRRRLSPPLELGKNYWKKPTTATLTVLTPWKLKLGKTLLWKTYDDYPLENWSWEKYYWNKPTTTTLLPLENGSWRKLIPAIPSLYLGVRGPLIYFCTGSPNWLIRP